MAPIELSMDILSARHVLYTYLLFPRRPSHALIDELTVYFYSPSDVFLVFPHLHLMYLCAANSHLWVPFYGHFPFLSQSSA